MDRTTVRKKYGPATYKRNTRRRKTGQVKYSFSEVIIIQCMVCGVIILLLLSINIINTPLTNSLSSSLKNTISKDISGEDNIEASFVSRVGNNIKAYFAGFLGIEEDETVQNNGNEEVVDVFSVQEGEMRIDEDILKDINNEGVQGGETGIKKPIVLLD